MRTTTTDQPMGVVAWWLGLAIAICLGTLFTIPYPFGLIAIAAIFGLVGYKIPMKIIANAPRKLEPEVKIRAFC